MWIMCWTVLMASCYGWIRAMPRTSHITSMAASEPLGAPYRRDAADTAALSCDEAWLHTLLLRRAEARLARDFSTADAILRQLRTMNIDVNDRTREWRADYDEHTSKRTPIGEADPKLDLRGSAEIARTLGAALLTQWRADGRRRGQTMTHGFHPTKALMEPLAVSTLLDTLPGKGRLPEWHGLP
jgi:hypothetical protein